MSGRSLMIAGALWLLASQCGAGEMAFALSMDGGIFVQEYEVDGGRRFCICNAREETVRLVLREVRHKSWERVIEGVPVSMPGRRVPGDTLAVMVLEPSACLDVSPVAATEPRLVEYVANGDRLGAVWSQDVPQVGSERRVVMPTSLNQPGWYRPGMWTEQDSLWVRSGEDFSIDLMLEDGAGKVTIHRQPGRFVFTERLIAPYDIESKTLEIAKSAELFVIETGPATWKPHVGRATMRFRAPEVETPSLFRLSGSWWVEPGRLLGFPLSRAVLVRPGAGDGLPPN